MHRDSLSTTVSWRLAAAGAALLFACSTEMPATNTPQLLEEGEVCVRDEDCATGMCASLPGETESVCRRSCEAGCKGGEVCTTLSVGAGGKLRAACVPEKAGLCRSCEFDGDCPYPADACLKLGESGICGRDCAFDGACPVGYRCAEAEAIAGGTIGSQCVPESGSCACLPETVGQRRPCEQTNEHGTCAGEETCSEDGVFSACDAREPAAESCNGEDDDCDGQTDEEIPEQSCGQGECLVELPGCVDGQPPVCEPKAPGVELCNGKDDDCDGAVDNGFDLQTDPENCGSCGHACGALHATAECRAGQCALGPCEAGWGDCDGSQANGCETDMTSSLLHCGGCSQPCQAPANATASCEGGCVYTCQAPWDDCNGSMADGCESNTLVDLDNCGVCQNKCAEVPSATAVCDAGGCGFACVGTARDCDGQAGNGCEADVQTDPLNCGVCGNACPTGTNGAATCLAATCGLGCSAPWQDCNGDPADGCESNRETDLLHCGACGNACPSAANATATCTATGCGLACTGTWADCNGDPADGCESDPATDPLNCGGCGNVCGGLHATGTCAGSACTLECEEGWADCDATAGCDTNLDNLGTPPQCTGVVDLGTLRGDTGEDQFVRSGFGEAVFKVHVDEDNTSSVYVSASVLLEVPAGIDYDLHVYRDTCGSNAQHSYGVAGQYELIDHCEPDHFMAEDAFDLWIEISFFSGDTCAPWTLTVAGNTVVDACE